MENKRDYYSEMKETYENAIKANTGEGKKVVSCVCPETFKKPCKLCDECKAVLWHKDKYTQEMIDKAGEYNRKEKYYANVVLASNPSEVVVFEYGPTIGNKLVSYEMGIDSDYKGFMDPDRGRNIVIIKYPDKDPKKTRYDVEARVNVTPLPDRSVLNRMINLDQVMEQMRSGSLKTLYQSKLPAGKTEMRFLPSWLGRQFASVFQLKYKIHYHTSEEELLAIQRGELNPLEDVITVKPETPASTTVHSDWGQGWGSPPTTKPEDSDWGTMAPMGQRVIGQPSTPAKETLGCFGTYDETEPECTIKCQKDGLMEGCKKEWEAKVAQRKVAKGLYR